MKGIKEFRPKRLHFWVVKRPNAGYMFKRIIDYHLDKWKTDRYRKPLLPRDTRKSARSSFQSREVGAQAAY